MPPLVRAALASALLAALAVMTDRPPKTIRVGTAARSSPSGGVPAPPGASAGLSALCPRGTLPDGEVCVPVPAREPSGRDAGTAPARVRAEHDRIERRPDRPEDFSKYRLPIDLVAGERASGTLLPAARGASVRLVRLEHQEGDAEVLFAGELPGVPGQTIVTRHAVRDAGGLRDYLAIFGNLARVEAAITRGAAPKNGQTLGVVGDAASPGSPALDYEIRRLRSGADVRSLEPADFIGDARTVGCDARNVLALLK